MAGRIPDSVLEDILSRTDVVELISGYIPLKKAGRNFKANCPFHHEKTPSFMVSADRQIYHCFGCGESGNAFKFLMRYERMEFIEAVEFLAKKYNISLPERQAHDPAAQNLVTQVYKALELASQYYSEGLRSPAGKAALSYLLNRGIKDETLKELQVGFAPDKWDGLISYLRSKALSLSIIEKAGLCLPREGGGFYDRFRNRIIFPIFDIKARVVGFGARVLDDSLPKYINSPETPVYTKGKNLYGLHLAKDAIRDNDFAVIVEGYMDFLGPYQEGLKNIVASQGTALTQEQARLLKRYTHNVIVVFDGDAAGELAALRSLDIFVEEEMDVRVVSLPAGHDPDTFVRKQGIAALRKNLDGALNLFDYKLNVSKSRYNHKEIEGKAKIAGLMLETINKFKNAVLKSEYIKKLSYELDVKEEALWQETGKAKKERDYPAGAVEADIKNGLQAHPSEKLLIKLLLEENTLVERVKADISPKDFSDERVARIVSVIFDLASRGKPFGPHTLINFLEDSHIEKFICESAFLPGEMTLEHKEKVVDDCVNRLKINRQKLDRNRLHQRIKEAQDKGDEELLHKLVEEFNDLIKKG